MLQIRQGVFETNSSSTHSITICSEDEYQKWVDGDMLFADSYCVDEDFVTFDEAKDIVREYEQNNIYRGYNPLELYYFDNDIKDGFPYTYIDDVPDNLLAPYLAYHGFYTCDYYFDERCKYYEDYVERYITESGDEIVAFGFYGHS